MTAGLLLFTTPQVVLIANALTFVASAMLLGGLNLGPDSDDVSAEELDRRRSIWAQTGAGVRAVADKVAREGYRFSSLVLGIVQSEAFQGRRQGREGGR